MKVKDLLARSTRRLITVTGEKTLGEALKMLIDHEIGSLIVVDNSGAAVGIISERDILRKAHSSRGQIMHMKVADHMTRELIIGVPEDDIDYIAQVITQNRIRHIPIIDENKKLAGIVSIGDIVKAKLDLAEVQLRYLTEYVTGRPHVDLK